LRSSNRLFDPNQIQLNKLTLKVDRSKLSPADIEKLKAATRNNRAAE
jgi:hypothetical protein